MALASYVQYASEHYVYRAKVFTLFQNDANLHNMSFIYFML